MSLLYNRCVLHVYLFMVSFNQNLADLAVVTLNARSVAVFPSGPIRSIKVWKITSVWSMLEYEILIWWEFWFLCTESEPQGLMLYEIWVTSLLLQKAIAIAQKASKEDQDGNYEEAILSYQHAVKYFLHIVKRGLPWLEINSCNFTQKRHTAETFQVILRVYTRSSVTVIAGWTN